MKETIVFLMKTTMIAEGLSKEFQNCQDYEAVITRDYENTELYLGDKTPKVAVIEVPDHSSYPLGYCLKVSQRLRKNYKGCKTMLFISYTYLDHILPEIIEAKRGGYIDAFTTSNNRLEEIIAHIKALG